MIINRCFELRGFVLAAVLSTGLSVADPVFAQYFMADLNSRDVTELEDLNNHDRYFFSVSAMNDSGRLVGRLDTADATRAFITGPNGVGITDLGTLGGKDSVAVDINDAGQVVGYSVTKENDFHAFITGPNGVGMTDLGTLGGSQSIGYGINATGQVVGTSDVNESGARHGFITGANGVGMRDLGTLGGTYSSAQDVNDIGQVVGSASIPTEESHAFITGPNGVGMVDLGTSGSNYSSSFAERINEGGEVIGFSRSPDGSITHFFITDPGGVDMRDIGTLGGRGATANDINDAGQVGGSSYTIWEQPHAFITGPYGLGIKDLNSVVSVPSGFVLSGVVGINNVGQVLAAGGLAPVPEPAPFALMLAGLGLVGFVARREKEKSNST